MEDASHLHFGHLPELYVLYGLVFMVLGIVLLAVPKDDTLPGALEDRRLIAVFGLTHGCLELWVAWKLLHGVEESWAQWITSAALVLSYAPLAELVRRRLATRSPRLFAPGSWLVLIAALAAWTLTAAAPQQSLGNAARLFLALPGAVGTGFALLSVARRESINVRPVVGLALRAAAVCFVLYGVLAGLVVDRDDALLPTTQEFLAVVGVPVQVVRMALGAALAICFSVVLETLRRQAEAGRLEALDIARSSAERLEHEVEERTQDLRTSEDRLRRAQHVANVGSWHENLRTGERWYSGQTCRMLGISLEGEYSAERFLQLMHPDDRGAMDEGWRSALKSGEFDLEFRVIVGGEQKWLRARAEFERDADGHAVEAIGTVQDITERKYSELRVSEAQLLLRSVIDATPDWIFVKDRDHRFVLVNRAFAASQHLRPADMVGRTDADFWPRALWEGDDELGHRGFHTDDDKAFTGVVVHNPHDVASLADGSELVFDTFKIPLRDAQGSVYAVLGYARDVTERHHATQRLATSLQQVRDAERRQRETTTIARREQSRMGALLAAMSIGILFEDHDGKVEYVNPSFLKMWSINSQTDLTGQSIRDVLEHATHHLARPEHGSRHVLHVLDTHEAEERLEVELQDGRVLTQISYPVEDPDGRTLGRLWIYEDITYERQTAQQLLYLAERDPLTGLHNRHRFQERLEEMVKAARRAHSEFALLYFDLDEFKQVNDNFGHRAGDTVLVRTAGELSTMLRSTELFARLGGDEFAVLSTISDSNDIPALANRIVSAVAGIPFRFRGTNIRVTASVGVALFPEHGSSTEDLVVHADMAMYQAKARGRNTWTIFDPADSESPASMGRMTWSQRLEQALAGDGVVVHYQGVHRSSDRAIVHLEALARMRDPSNAGRLIMPGQFIPFAERTGQVVELDRQVLGIVVEQLAARPGMPPVAVNISGRSFDDPTLPDYIRSLLTQHSVSPARLLVELTETAAVSDIEDAQRFIEALQRMGCRVCLDDFGSGFSSFAYLKHVPADILKIDGLFIRDLPNNRDNQVFLRAMVDVGKGLRMLTVAEGVETEEDFFTVRELGVDLVQGYFLGRPTPDHPALSE